MNKLQLVSRLCVECGVSVSTLTTTVDQSGEYRRMVNWLDAAHLDIQQQHLWDFLWEENTEQITTGNWYVAGDIAAARYDRSEIFDANGAALSYVPWGAFKDAYPTHRIYDGLPTVWTIRPDKALAVNAKVQADTVLTVRRWKNPVVLVDDTDSPLMPEENHLSIVYRAMLLYFNFDEAGASRLTTQVEYDRAMASLTFTELGDMTFGAPLA